jgi:L-threonylcarbamoyladenylate synthase
MRSHQILTDNVDDVATILISGGLAIVPTDTVYGVAASMSRPDALRKIFEAKGRSTDKPLPVLLDSVESAPRYAQFVSQVARTLMLEFWPGKLTIVVPASPNVPAECRAADETVGLRVPAHVALQELIAMCGGAIAVTSANRSGGPETTTATAAYAQLADYVDIALDYGRLSSGPSTVVYPHDGKFHVLREGAIELATLEAAIKAQALSQ